MPSLSEVREKYPQYSDMSDADLAGALHKKFYADMPREQFDQKIGLSPVAEPAIAPDVAKSAGVGLGKGVIGLAGLPGDARTLAGVATDYIGGAVGASPEAVDRFKGVAQTVGSYLPFGQQFARNPTSQDIRKKVESVTGEFYKPQTLAGEYAQTAGEFLPAAAAGPGGVGRRILAQALMPAVASESAGQVYKGEEAEPYARFAGAVAGATAPGVLARALNPMNPSPHRMAAADVLRQEGIPVTAGQVTGNNFLRAMESPFGGNNERQLEALTSAAMRRAGNAGGRATRGEVDDMLTRLGGEFDRLAANNTAVLDRQFGQDVQAAVGNYRNLVSQPNRVPAIDNFLQEIAQAAAANQGAIPGRVYQSIQSRMERAASGARGDPEAASALREMREALHDAMERSMAAAGSPDLGAWRETRRQYRNALPIMDAVTAGGEAGGLGLLTPGQLSQAVTRDHGRRNRARGRGDFSELVDAADALLRPLPNSGTPVRSAVSAIPAAIGALLTGGAINTRPVQAYLSGRIPGQQAIANQSSTVSRDALAQALIRSMIPVQ